MIFNGVPRYMFTIVLLCSLACFSQGEMQCRTKSPFNILGPSSCPSPFSSSSEEFCCESDSGRIYCCEVEEYFKINGAEYLIPIISGIALGILVGCFLCCLCCPCCMLYKRRHRGTVYGRVQQPCAIVTVQQPMMPPQGNMPNSMPMPMSMPMPQTGTTTQMPMPQAGIPPQTALYPGGYSGQNAAPPPYSAAVANDVYSKQAPYNPHFVNN